MSRERLAIMGQSPDGTSLVPLEHVEMAIADVLDRLDSIEAEFGIPNPLQLRRLWQSCVVLAVQPRAAGVVEMVDSRMLNTIYGDHRAGAQVARTAGLQNTEAAPDAQEDAPC